MRRRNGIHVRELLEKTYADLVRTNRPRRINFESAALSEIADNSDRHEIGKGYMSYEGAGLFECNEGIWMISRGEASGSYPADSYDSDIMALKIDSETASRSDVDEKLREAINNTSYFRNSIIHGTKDGNLHAGDLSRFRKTILGVLHPHMERFTVEKTQHDEDEILASTVDHFYKQTTTYHLGLVEFLSATIESILRINPKH